MVPCTDHWLTSSVGEAPKTKVPVMVGWLQLPVVSALVSMVGAATPST